MTKHINIDKFIRIVPDIKYPYYDVINNLIYLKKYEFNNDYYHELNHFKDHQNKLYKKLSIYFNIINELTVYLFPFYILLIIDYYFGTHINYSTDIFITIFSLHVLYTMFRFCEEIRAIISAKLSVIRGYHVRI